MYFKNYVYDEDKDETLCYIVNPNAPTSSYSES